MGRLTRRSFVPLLVGLCADLAAGPVAATPLAATPLAAEEVPTIGRPEGKPRILLDRLTFPDVRGRERYVRHLRFVIRREARRADWGAGRKSRISLRFVVEELSVRARGSAVEVRCSARGELPGGRRARSRLVYGGDPKQEQVLVERVLEIVARGVVGRLAELERVRRSA